MLYLLDSVKDAIARDIAMHPPERGGALLGPIHQPLITCFLFDAEAETTGVTYRPSRQLNGRVKDTERTQNLEFKGIIHSHPSGLDHPSGQDEIELGKGLELNPHLSHYLAPIVTTGASMGVLQAHETRCGEGKISFFAAYRANNNKRARIRPMSLKEIPMLQDLERVRAAYGGLIPAETFVTDMAGVEMLAGKLQLDGLELLLLASPLYPAIPPLLLFTDAAGNTEEKAADWSLQLSPDERLLAAVRPYLRAPGPYRKVYGLPELPALTADAERARIAGWPAYYTGQSPEATQAHLREQLRVRSNGLLPDALNERHLLLVGLGSVGSYAAEQLVRSGVGRLTLVDAEAVEAANLSRASYSLPDIGQKKTEALARRLLHINPGLDLTLLSVNAQDIAIGQLQELVRAADLVFAATDDNQAQQLLNHFAYALEKPALFAGLYAGAKGGEVIATDAPRTACYLCATRMRHAAQQGADQILRETDYATGRLVGEVALGADIQHVTSAAVKMALSLLIPRGAEARLKDFLEPQLASGNTYLTFSMTPDYWFYPALFGETPGQFAYQAVWMAPERASNCPVCGEADFRADPCQSVLRAPRIDLSLLAEDNEVNAM